MTTVEAGKRDDFKINNTVPLIFVNVSRSTVKKELVVHPTFDPP
jgi:hypothetical protein